MIFDAVGDLALEDLVPDAFCSALVDDCIQRGKTIKEGGAVYDVISGLQSGETIQGIEFPPGFEPEAKELVKLLGLPAGAARPLTWKTPYSLTVAAGELLEGDQIGRISQTS